MIVQFQVCKQSLCRRIKKKQNIENNSSSPEDNITDNSKVSVEEDTVNQDINQDKESESKINDQEEIIPIEPKFNLEQVEAIKKEAEELEKTRIH